MIRRIATLFGLLLIAAATVLVPSNFKMISGDLTLGHQVDVRASNLSVVCPGPILLNASSKVGSFAPTGSAAVQVAHGQAVGVQNQIQLFGGESQNLTSAAATISRSASVTAVDPNATAAQGSALLTASQLQTVNSGQAAGLLGAQCQKASSDSWIVGGDTTTGREALLVLANPTLVDATVDLEIFATGGRLTGPGLSGISVAKQQTVVIPINGLTPKVDTFAVHVQSSGGSVAAWIQQRVVRGLVPAGVDFIAPSSVLAKRISIPGFLIRGSEAITALQAKSTDFADIGNSVRVFNPNEVDAHVLVQITGVGAKTFGTVLQQTVPARSVIDLATGQLSDGDYSITVTSDVAVRAAAKLNRAGKASKPATDFTWLPSVAAQSGERAVAVPAMGISKLALMNTSNAASEVVITDAQGARRLTISSGGGMVVAVSAGRVLISSDSNIAATLVTDLASSIASIPLVEYQNLGGQLNVLVR